MFNIVLLKTVTCSSTFKFDKALFRLNSLIVRLIDWNQPIPHVRTVEDNIFLNQILQIQFDDDN